MLCPVLSLRAHSGGIIFNRTGTRVVADFRNKRRSCLFVAAMLVGLLILVALMIYTSDRAPDPASRPPDGAMPPQGEPMRPAKAKAALSHPIKDE